MLLFSSQIITDGTSIAYGIGQWLTIDSDVYNNSMTRDEWKFILGGLITLVNSLFF